MTMGGSIRVMGKCDPKKSHPNGFIFCHSDTSDS